MMYRIYGKHVSEKRFKAFDMGASQFVENLMYASVWNSKKDVLAALNYINDQLVLQEMNKEYIFEIRKV